MCIYSIWSQTLNLNICNSYRHLKVMLQKACGRVSKYTENCPQGNRIPFSDVQQQSRFIRVWPS